MIIVFCGTDGAGKSSQIERLHSKMETERGKRLSFIWARGGYTPGFSFIKQIIRTLFGKKAPSAGNSSQRDQLMKKSSVSKSWLIIAIWDLIFYYGVYLRYLNLRYDMVLCDRYVKDTELDFEHHHGNSFKRDGFLWRMLQKLVPKPTFQFLLYVPVHISEKRSKLKGEPFPDSPETLEFRLSNYLDGDRFPSSQYTKIECTQSLEAIHQQIVYTIDNHQK